MCTEHLCGKFGWRQWTKNHLHWNIKSQSGSDAIFVRHRKFHFNDIKYATWILIFFSYDVVLHLLTVINLIEFLFISIHLCRSFLSMRRCCFCLLSIFARRKWAKKTSSVEIYSIRRTYITTKYTDSRVCINYFIVINAKEQNDFQMGLYDDLRSSKWRTLAYCMRLQTQGITRMNAMRYALLYCV